MKRKRKSVGVIAFIIFVVLIFVSGYALRAAGYDDNPFDQISFLSNWANGGEGRFARDFAATNDGSADFSLPSSSTDSSEVSLTDLSNSDNQFSLSSTSDLSNSDTNTTASDFGNDTFAPPDRGGEDQNNINWSDFGSVLYDFWFICAVTAVFIVVQRTFKFSIKQVKNRLPVMAAAK
jgi:hypothetical protein